MFLAIKEMTRAKVRFGLLVLAVAVLAYLILLIQGLTTGLIDQFIGAIKNQSADVLVYGEQARKNLEGSVITPEQLAGIEASAEGSLVGRLGEGTFTVEAGGRQQDAVVFGYELDRCADPSDGCGDRTPGAPTTLVEGRYPSSPGEAVASSRNADAGFDIGDTITVIGDGGQTTITVVGLAEEINFSVAPTVFASWDTYVEARNIRNPDIAAQGREVWPSAAAIITADGVDPQALVDQIDAAVPLVEPMTRDQAVNGSPGVSSVRQSLGGVVLITLLIVPIVASFFFVILTVQKRSTFTLLRAIGARRRVLVGTILLQAAVVLLGGYLVALLLIELTDATGIAGDVAVALSPGVVLGILAVLVVLSGIGLLFSVLRVLRADPLEATQTQGMLA